MNSCLFQFLCFLKTDFCRGYWAKRIYTLTVVKDTAKLLYKKYWTSLPSHQLELQSIVSFFFFFFFARGTVKKWYFILVLILYITHHWVKLNIFSYIFVSYVLLHLWFVFLYFAFCNWTIFFLICRNSLLIWDSTILLVMYVANILWSYKQNGSMTTPGILLLLLAQAEDLCPSLSGSGCDSTQVCFGLRAPLPPRHTSKSWLFPVCKAYSSLHN